MNIRPSTAPHDWLDSECDWSETHQKISEAELDRFIAARIPVPKCSTCADECHTPQACERPEPPRAVDTLRRQRRVTLVIAIVLGAVICYVSIAGYFRAPT